MTAIPQVGGQYPAPPCFSRVVCPPPKPGTGWCPAGWRGNLPAMTDPAVSAARQAFSAASDDETVLVRLFAALDACGCAGTPQEAVARSNRAEKLRRRGDLAAAEAEHRAALRWLPGFGGIHFNLGVLLLDTGRAGEALAALLEATRLMPGFAPAWASLGAARMALGRFAAAEKACDAALERDPLLVAARLNRGAARRERGRFAEAHADFRAVLAMVPDLAEAWANLGVTVREIGDPAAAIPALTRALAIGLPDPGGVLAQLIQQKRHLCRWDGLPELSARLVGLVERQETRTVPPWIFLGEGAGRDAELACARAYAAWRTLGVGPLADPFPPRGAERRLRIGYLSSDFHEHATAVLIAELIERHDRDAFIVTGYSYGPDDGGPLRARLSHGFDRFVDLAGVPDGEAARRIRADGTDILIDLKGHTQGARPGICANRPAPVQATWLGYPGTTGAAFFDYVIADPVVAPPAHASAYSERIARLPWCYQPNDRTRSIASAPTRTACGLPEDAVVFCCFNAAYKINPAIFRAWIRILRAVPGSVLWLLESHPEAAANLRREASALGFDPARLVFAPRRPLPEYLARYRLADLFLDTAPVGAHTTASDALWAGCPVLTVLGPSFAGRVAASLLRAAGLPELVMGSLADYEAAARRLAFDTDLRAVLRNHLAATRSSAALWDTDALARALEDLYRRMWAERTGGVG